MSFNKYDYIALPKDGLWYRIKAGWLYIKDPILAAKTYGTLGSVKCPITKLPASRGKLATHPKGIGRKRNE